MLHPCSMGYTVLDSFVALQYDLTDSNQPRVVFTKLPHIPTPSKIYVVLHAFLVVQGLYDFLADINLQ